MFGRVCNIDNEDLGCRVLNYASVATGLVSYSYVIYALIVVTLQWLIVMWYLKKQVSLMLFINGTILFGLSFYF